MIKRRLLRTPEVAEVLGISARTLTRYVKLGLLKPTETTLGGHYRWDLQDVRAQIAKLRRDHEAPSDDS
ncbi:MULTISPECIES: helix-turn-helix domain-containing protein [Amycolatopsis]|uniref:Helix-turn-helix domain-containing protein n=1 Tax=Amycolatopsis thermalba TaxID=944492 RepID=A0ABY4P5K4_9PSEU|nr:MULTISPECIES: helix-turn-helix domain-containing protein [Amycolatopsis]OXM70764.1 MerR family DNA-binding transcriptional regulator [Amycolatopsis sp. KNN50.9b]UQS27715.1 helix-turn-helix domain-containing protein [Amycolatopsis thermalba]